MLCTKQKVLRRFWYATIPVAKLDDGPKPFTLLGEKLVLFLDGEGKPAALADRCCHRTARLSKGWSQDGYITCGYHGWTYDRAGKLVRIPQFSPEQPLPDARVKAFDCDTRYGYVWVALEQPLLPIPDLPEDRDPAYRRIHQFDDRWNTAALRMMENSFDNAHFSFVHKSTFGQLSQPKPEKYELVETDYGFRAETIVPINNPPAAFRVTGTTEPTTKRHMRNAWFMPFCRTLDIEYPSGLRHIIFNSATPIDDGSIQLVQILFRNDREEDCSTQELIDWDAAIIVDEPRYFVDEQKKGPYQLWRHAHHFEDLGDGRVRLLDGVTYALPFSWLSEPVHRWLVRRQLKRIFDHRAERVAEFFRGAKPSAAPF